MRNSQKESGKKQKLGNKRLCVEEGNRRLRRSAFLRVYRVGRKIRLSLRTTAHLQKYRKCLGLTFAHKQKIPWQWLFLQPLTLAQECFGA